MKPLISLEAHLVCCYVIIQWFQRQTRKVKETRSKDILEAMHKMAVNKMHRDKEPSTIVETLFKSFQISLR